MFCAPACRCACVLSLAVPLALSLSLILPSARDCSLCACAAPTGDPHAEEKAAGHKGDQSHDHNANAYTSDTQQQRELHSHSMTGSHATITARLKEEMRHTLQLSERHYAGLAPLSAPSSSHSARITSFISPA